MDRYFLMQSDRHGGWFCGKCGKRLVPDFYNAQKHAEACGFSGIEEGESRNVICDHDPGYRLYAKEGNLHLQICFPELVKIPGFRDRFSGLKWIPAMETVFRPGEKEPVVLANSTGMDLDLWLSLIRAGKCCRIHDSDVEIIREVFPGIIGLYSLQMFVHIYRTKGFRHVRLLSDQTAQRLLMIGHALQAGQAAQGQSELEVRETGKYRPRAGRREKLPLEAALFRKEGGDRFLKVTVGTEARKPEKTAAFLFSRGYAACTPGADIGAVLRGEYRLSVSAERAVRRFADLYPEYNLAQYLERSANILIPLIAPDYHNLLELSAKAAVPAVAENMARLSQFEQDPFLYTNLRDAFGLPLHVLRALEPGDIREGLLEKLSAINLCNPAFLQFDHYTEDMLDFYQCLHVPSSVVQAAVPSSAARAAVPSSAARAAVSSSAARAAREKGQKRSGDNGRYRVDILAKDFTGKQVLQILRYLYRREASWELLRDYINTCELLGEYPYGFLPRIPLTDAHDRAAARYRSRQSSEENARFRRTVRSERYLALTTSTSEEDLENFGEEAFVVISPGEMEDLVLESESMHNCVRIYSQSVLRGQCRIYFLRKKENPDASFGTIEVRGNQLVQAKGFANERLGNRAQAFIRKWCAVKHLQIRTRDITPVR